MTRTLGPFPIFPTMSTFVRCINDGLDFPANIHVLERLSLNVTFTEFLRFIHQPDSNWVSRSPARSRFNSAGQPVLTAHPINPAWRPCYRRDPDAPIVSTVMRQIRGITYGFLTYLNRIGARELPVPSMAKSPETPDSKGLETTNLLSHEIDWLFAHLQSKCQFSVELQLCRFLLAVARYTTIPLADLSPDTQHVGLLSQFMTYPRSPEPGDPPRCSP